MYHDKIIVEIIILLTHYDVTTNLYINQSLITHGETIKSIQDHNGVITFFFIINLSFLSPSFCKSLKLI